MCPALCRSHESRYRTIGTTFYATGASLLTTKQIDLTADTIKAALFTTSYTPSTTDSSYTALTGEATGSGYAGGGRALSNKRWLDEPSARRFVFDADDMTWTAVTVSFRYVVLYDDSLPSKPLIAVIDLGTNQSATNQDLTLRWQYQSFDPGTGESATSSGLLAVAY